MKKRRQYTQAFKARMIGLVEKGVPLAEVAKTHKVEYNTLYNWCARGNGETKQPLATKQTLAPKQFIKKTATSRRPAGTLAAKPGNGGVTKTVIVKERLFTETQVENIVQARLKIETLQNQIENLNREILEVEMQAGQ